MRRKTLKPHFPVVAPGIYNHFKHEDAYQVMHQEYATENLESRVSYRRMDRLENWTRKSEEWYQVVNYTPDHAQVRYLPIPGPSKNWLPRPPYWRRRRGHSADQVLWLIACWRDKQTNHAGKTWEQYWMEKKPYADGDGARSNGQAGEEVEDRGDTGEGQSDPRRTLVGPGAQPGP